MPDVNIEVFQPSPIVVESHQPEPVVIAISPAGPQGPPGPSGGQAVVQGASTPLSALRAVRSDGDGSVSYCDSQTPADALAFLGITTSAGTSVHVRVSGEVDGFAGLIPNAPVYVGPLGALTQIPPLTGFVLRVGFARTATKLFIEPGQPIFR